MSRLVLPITATSFAQRSAVTHTTTQNQQQTWDTASLLFSSPLCTRSPCAFSNEKNHTTGGQSSPNRLLLYPLVFPLVFSFLSWLLCTCVCYFFFLKSFDFGSHPEWNWWGTGGDYLFFFLSTILLAASAMWNCAIVAGWLGRKRNVSMNDWRIFLPDTHCRWSVSCFFFVALFIFLSPFFQFEKKRFRVSYRLLILDDLLNKKKKRIESNTLKLGTWPLYSLFFWLCSPDSRTVNGGL